MTSCPSPLQFMGVALGDGKFCWQKEMAMHSVGGHNLPQPESRGRVSEVIMDWGARL